jgi:hypothetical protein
MDERELFIELIVAVAPTAEAVAAGVQPSEENMAHAILRGLSTAELVAVASDLQAAEKRGDPPEQLLIAWLSMRPEEES